MKDHDIKSVLIASRHLGVSDTTLKSIMTDKGEVRYSQGTLKTVLKKIGLKSGE